MTGPNPYPMLLAYLLGASLGGLVVACVNEVTCPKAGESEWTASAVHESTCEYEVPTPPLANCTQVSYRIVDCDEWYDYRCANGIEKLLYFDTAKGTGVETLVAPDGCRTSYEIVR